MANRPDLDPEEPRERRPRSRTFRLVRLVVCAVLAVPVLTMVLILPWRWIPLPTSAFMLRESGQSDVPIRYHWVGWDRISPNLAVAAVAAEDQKFPLHRGFDLEQIAMALEEREQGRTRGASTISQQVAKNLFLWPGQSYFRKGLEAYLTVWIETLWPKRRILEIYLNVAEFGPGVFGAYEASLEAFDKPPSDLTLEEAAILAAVLPSPKRMSIARPSDYVRRRAGEIVAGVRSLGGVTYLSEL